MTDFRSRVNIPAPKAPLQKVVIEYEDGNIVHTKKTFEDGEVRYYNADGLLHKYDSDERAPEPAIITAKGDEYCFRNGKLHGQYTNTWCFMRPSVKTVDGLTFYHKDGVLHRTDYDECGDQLPAYIDTRKWGNVQENRKEYWIDGKRVRAKCTRTGKQLPAIEDKLRGDIYSDMNGKWHRIDGPTIDNKRGKFYYIHGLQHRIGGPAVELTGNIKEWWLFGKRYNEADYNAAIEDLNEFSFKVKFTDKDRTIIQIVGECGGSLFDNTKIEYISIKGRKFTFDEFRDFFRDTDGGLLYYYLEDASCFLESDDNPDVDSDFVKILGDRKIDKEIFNKLTKEECFSLGFLYQQSQQK